jgi:hypothetical protein
MMLDGLKRLRQLAAAAALEVFQPSPKLTVSQWADANRLLPETSAEPGRFRTDRIPYLRKIQDTLGDETIGTVVFAKSAQVAGSTAGENFVGFLMDHAPCAILEVWPTEKKLQKWSLTRLDPMLRDTPSLAKKFPRSGRREAGNSLDKKLFPGGWLMAITAKSTSDLKSDSARVAVAEEVDEWEGDVGEQGDPLALLRVRLVTFWNGKLYIVSTPTLEGSSRIWSELEDSTWNEYWVPCPECGEYQTLRWRDGDESPEEAGEYRLVWDKDEEGRVIRGTTRYVCVNGCVIHERHKQQMLERGEWRARFPGRPTVGFHINTIYSPLCRWDTIAEEFAKAVRKPQEMKTFVNTKLGLPYREKGESINAHFLASREEQYPLHGEGEHAIEMIPRGVGLLTAGVDVQGDRIELLVWGWGAGEERWLIEWEVLNGDPGRKTSGRSWSVVASPHASTRAGRRSRSPRCASTPAIRRTPCTTTATRAWRSTWSPSSGAMGRAASCSRRRTGRSSSAPPRRRSARRTSSGPTRGSRPSSQHCGREAGPGLCAFPDVDRSRVLRAHHVRAIGDRVSPRPRDACLEEDRRSRERGARHDELRRRRTDAPRSDRAAQASRARRPGERARRADPRGSGHPAFAAAHRSTRAIEGDHLSQAIAATPAIPVSEDS